MEMNAKAQRRKGAKVEGLSEKLFLIGASVDLIFAGYLVAKADWGNATLSIIFAVNFFLLFLGQRLVRRQRKDFAAFCSERMQEVMARRDEFGS